MKKDFNTKKKITVVALSVVAVCIAGGLLYSIGGTEQVPQNEPSEEVSKEVDVDIVVPEISDVIVIDPSTDIIVEDEKGDDVDDVIETNPVTSSTDEEKPKTKDDAVAPTDDTPPEVDENGEEELKVVEPNKVEDTPASGETSSDGSVYVPGFGWVPYEGENSNIDAPNAGTGDSIGTMN